MRAAAGMRYLSTVTNSMPIFIIAFIWGALGVSLAWLAVASLGSLASGVLLGRHMSRVMMKNLIHGQDHFLVRRAPGGIWFFVGLGLLAALAGVAVFLLFGRTTGLIIVRTGAVVFGLGCCAAFGSVGLTVLRLERSEGRHVYMGPTGFFFDS